ncbi:hypothetical protein MNEG_11734 [Monoraphidium neglectum]|uniref:Uncharacterized protein n=1 Tax=Monoraphidium neglectum TaxID=145388 RepID=A0A0D2MNE0_9CHLO|nr:hypothetical protein MNEG_11734 [Monoraphidium neglectum]KIY96230.1 hypothetical protein MNEG_11734 [Monoraphidium neglectum]|eukprot:XP_013895250.1 hypothetical protein MNEG_11734 [Monoraphidium neglectum]
MLLNGDFEKDKSLGATKLIGWAKLKENSTVGGGGLYNGSILSYDGRPGYPFDNPNRYFRTRQARSTAKGNIAFALVNNAPFNVTSKRQKIYFDWFVDNPWPYYFVVDTMSLLANHSDIVQHQARVDLYDYDKLKPPGNYSDLAAQVFDQYSATAGDAYLGPVLSPNIVAHTHNLQSMATEVPLEQYVGKRILFVFRYSTNTYFLGFGLDNVQVVECNHEDDWSDLKV